MFVGVSVNDWLSLYHMSVCGRKDDRKVYYSDSVVHGYISGLLSYKFTIFRAEREIWRHIELEYETCSNVDSIC